MKHVNTRLAAVIILCSLGSYIFAELLVPTILTIHKAASMFFIYWLASEISYLILAFQHIVHIPVLILKAFNIIVMDILLKPLAVCLWLDFNTNCFIYIPIIVLILFTTIAPIYFQIPMRLFINNTVVLHKVSSIYKKAIIFDSFILISSLYMFMYTLWLLANRGRLPNTSDLFLHDSISINAYTILISNFIFLFMLLILKMSRSFIVSNTYTIEYFFLMIFVILFCICAVVSNDIFSMFLGLEGLSVCLYMMVVVSDVKSHGSVESALKYFFMGSLSSLLAALGITFIYSFYGSLNYNDIADFHYSYGIKQKRDFFLIIGTLLVILNFLFKLSVPPMHVWVPDTFSGIWIHPIVVLSTVVKFANFTIFVNWYLIVCRPVVYGGVNTVNGLLIILSIVGMFIGATEAMHQSKIKKFLAYTSINQLSTCLLAVTSLTVFGFSSALLHIFTYVMLNIMFFFVILKMSERVGKSITYFSDLSKFTFIEVKYAFILMMIIFTFAGTPPTIMFFTKLLILKSLLISGKCLCAVLVLVMNIYSSLYYIKLIKILLIRGYDISTDVVKLNKSYFARPLMDHTTHIDISVNANYSINTWYGYNCFSDIGNLSVKKSEFTEKINTKIDVDKTTQSVALNSTQPVDIVNYSYHLLQIYYNFINGFILLFILMFILSPYVINHNVVEFISNLLASSWLSIVLETDTYLVDQMLNSSKLENTKESLKYFLNLF